MLPKNIACLALYLLIAPSFANGSNDDWWDLSTRGSQGLPALIYEGWEVVGFSAREGEFSVTFDYVLQHQDKKGLWHCNSFSFLPEGERENETIANCTAVRTPD